MAHARLAPSGSSRWMKCPGSIYLEAQYPDTENEYLLRGTAAHWVAEQCLKHGQTPGYYLNTPVEVKKADGSTELITLDQEDIASVFAYYEYVKLREEELKCKAAIEMQVNPGWWLGEREDLYGTADAVLYGPNHIEVIDFKHGSGHLVLAESNVQLLLYAIGAVARLNWEGKSTKNVIIQMTIVQPRCPHPDGPIRSWTISMDDLLCRLEEFTMAAAATDNPNAPLVPGESQCRWCRAKHACPELQKQVLDVFKPTEEYEQDSVNSGSDAQTQNLPTHPTWGGIENQLGKPASVLNPEQLAQVLDMAPMVRAWLQAVVDYANEQAEAGVTIPGFKLVAAITRRKWSLNDEEIIKKLAGMKDVKGKKLPKADVITVKPLSIAQAEKLLKPRLTERVWKNVEKLVIKPEGKPTLVPLTDPGEPLKKVEEVFQPVDQPAQKLPW